jgi:hypothetical protein
MRQGKWDRQPKVSQNCELSMPYPNVFILSWFRAVSCRVVSCPVLSCPVVSCRVLSCRVVCQRSLVFFFCPLSLIPLVSSWVLYPFPVDSESARRPPTSVTTCWNVAATFCVRPSLRCGHAAEPCKPRARSALHVRNHSPTHSPLPCTTTALVILLEWSLFKPCCGMAFAL